MFEEKVYSSVFNSVKTIWILKIVTVKKAKLIFDQFKKNKASTFSFISLDLHIYYSAWQVSINYSLILV